ncbi:MAG: hypothetical protein U0172_04550 [Nitrospiraceae bacterium]
MRHGQLREQLYALGAWCCLVGLVSTSGCARLPSPTAVVHEDARVVVTLQREVGAQRYTHPAALADQDLASVLKGYSLREEQRLPLRWYAEETPPNVLFRDDEIELLAPRLAAALARAKPEERVAFALHAPGYNPHAARDVTSGWAAVRGEFFLLRIEHFHTQQPLRSTDPYDYNYPTPPLPPKTYLLYFEPGQVFVTEPETNQRAVLYRDAMKAGIVR